MLANDRVARGIYLMRLRAPGIARTCRPAQFINIRTDAGLSPFLRRPFSTLRVDRSAGWLDIYYDAIGPGTQRLAGTVPGDTLHITGPLGNPFTAPAEGRLLMVAGGVGIVPLAFLAYEEDVRRGDMVLLVGAQSAERLPDMNTILPTGLETHLATDDGSRGHHGFVTELIAAHADPGTTILTCGPHGMMARVAEIAAERDLPCFASLENHMACGFGACVGCVVEYREAGRDDERYRRVCIEGPVVDAHAIVW